MTATRPFELYLMSLMRGEQAIAAALASIEVTPDAYRTTAKWMAESIGFDRVTNSRFYQLDLRNSKGVLLSPVEYANPRQAL